MNLNYYKNILQEKKNLYFKNKNLKKYAFLKKAINNIISSNYDNHVINNMLLATCMHGCHNCNNCHDILLYFLKNKGVKYE